jgi:hypothetical protein
MGSTNLQCSSSAEVSYLWTLFGHIIYLFSNSLLFLSNQTKAKGLWVIDESTKLLPQVSAKYRIQIIDFMHAVMSILVFVAIALFDQNVVNCFFFQNHQMRYMKYLQRCL